MDGVAKRSWRDRAGRETRHTEHREVVRQELPDELRALILEIANVNSRQSLELAQIKTRVAGLETALASLAQEALKRGAA